MTQVAILEGTQPVGWSGDVERRLAREALARARSNSRNLDELLADLSAEAARLVKGGFTRAPLAAVA